MTTSDVVKVTLDGAGLKLEREVPKEIGEQIAVLIFSGGAMGGSAGATGSSATALKGASGAGAAGPANLGSAAALSVREFLNGSDAKRSPDKIAAIGVYLKDHNHKDLFTKDDVQKGFEDAGEPVPGNLPRDVKWAVKAGWIAPKSGAAGQYYVTNTGRDAVAKKFPKDLLKKTRIEGGSKKTNKKGSGN